MKRINKNPVFEKRTVQLQSILKSNEAFLTVSPADIYYLTGCTGSNNHVLILNEEVYLFTDGRYLTQIKDQAQFSFNIEEISVQHPFGEVVATVLKKHDIQLLKFSPDHLSYLVGKSVLEALPNNAQAVKDSTLFELRSIKDEMEIEVIRQNLLYTKAAFLAVIPLIKAGITEKELAAELEYYCRKQFGIEKMSFDSIVASGHRSSMPHGIASDKVIENNDMIQFDFGFIKDKYCSDFSRTVAFGAVDPKLLEIRQIVEDALKKVITEARCGMTGIEIDAIARDYITEKGYAECFGHGLGHSLGLEVHENPRLNTVWDKPIVENMVLTIEPGIYIPGLGGVRLEDVVVMRSKGFELLTDCGYEF